MIIQNNDPRTQPSFSLVDRARRQIWSLVWLIFFRMSPRPFHKWRRFILLSFGAKIGQHTHVYPGVTVWAPWNLEIGSYVGIGDGVNIYNMDKIRIDDYAVVSQGSHLCAGTHDYNSQNFQLYAKPIHIGAHAWICADAFIGPGVKVAEGTVVGARSVVTKSILEDWAVYAGHPARRLSKRENHHNEQKT